MKSDANVRNILKKDGVMSSFFDKANQSVCNVHTLIAQYGVDSSWSHTLVDTESNSATLICQLPGEGNRKHYHPDWNEWWFIVDGSWEWDFDGEIRCISKGDVVFIPKNIPHKITAVGERAAIRIAVSRYDVAHIYEEKHY
ncbi:MAG: cupin domain-containing protein [Aeromonas veronii]